MQSAESEFGRFEAQFASVIFVQLAYHLPEQLLPKLLARKLSGWLPRHHPRVIPRGQIVLTFAFRLGGHGQETV